SGGTVRDSGTNRVLCAVVLKMTPAFSESYFSSYDIDMIYRSMYGGANVPVDYGNINNTYAFRALVDAQNRDLSVKLRKQAKGIWKLFGAGGNITLRCLVLLTFLEKTLGQHRSNANVYSDEKAG